MSDEEDQAEIESPMGDPQEHLVSQDFTIDDLGAAYAEAMVEAGLMPERIEDESSDSTEASPAPETSRGKAEYTATPAGIVEAALFLGHPENQPLASQEIARVMRDVSPTEVESMIDDLNTAYEQDGHSMRIVREASGYRMVLSPEVESVRRVFYGKVREARLSQGAVEILSLVAYQPGISAQELARLRGRDCGPLLNQLLRRQLLSVTREKPDGQGRPMSKYQTTDRFLQLFGLQSLDDLPHVDESGSPL